METDVNGRKPRYPNRCAAHLLSYSPTRSRADGRGRRLRRAEPRAGAPHDMSARRSAQWWLIAGCRLAPQGDCQRLSAGVDQPDGHRRFGRARMPAAGTSNVAASSNSSSHEQEIALMGLLPSPRDDGIRSFGGGYAPTLTMAQHGHSICDGDLAFGPPRIPARSPRIAIVFVFVEYELRTPVRRL